MIDHALIERLQAVQHYPSVSVLAPMEMISPANKQNAIVVKNLVKEVEHRLAQEFSGRESEDLLKKLHELADGVDYMHTLKGLALYVGGDVAEAVHVPYAVDARTVVDKTFATRDLVFAELRSPSYLLLTVSEQHARLFLGHGADLKELHDHGFPFNLEGKENIAQRDGHRTRHPQHDAYLEVDRHLAEANRRARLPIVLAGVHELVAEYRKLTAQRERIAAEVAGNQDHANIADLGKAAEVALETWWESRRQAALDEIGGAVSAQRVASGLADVWRMTNEGRGDLLVVERGYRQAVRDTGGEYPELTDDTAAPGVIDDGVDEVIEKVLHAGGRVMIVAPGKLDAHSRIALKLRY